MATKEGQLAAVTFGQMNALKAISKIGIQQGLYDWAKDHPLVVIKLTSSAFTFSKKGVTGDIAAVAVTVAQLGAIGKGTLGNLDKNVLKTNIRTALLATYLYIEKKHWDDGKPLHVASSPKAAIDKALAQSDAMLNAELKLALDKVAADKAEAIVEGTKVFSKLPIPNGVQGWYDGHVVHAINDKTCAVDGEEYGTPQLTAYLIAGNKLTGNSIIAATQLGFHLTSKNVVASAVSKALGVKDITPEGLAAFHDKLPPHIQKEIATGIKTIKGDGGDGYLLDDAVHGIGALAAASKPKKEGIFSILPEISDDEPTHTMASASTWGAFPFADMMTAPLVKLRDATRLYEPVHGSSPGSRYFLVGATKSFRIAARWQDGPNRLSIRIEPSADAKPNTMGKFTNTIVGAGFDQPSAQQNYASVHLDCGDVKLGAKTLAAVLAGLGLTFQTPIPHFKIIAGVPS